MVTARKTAATEPAAKKTPAKKATGGALVKWDEQLAALASKAKKTVANVGGGDWISVQGGKLTFQGNAVPDNTLSAVILAGLCENALYEGKFDPKNPQPPVCFAFGEDEDEMAPHPKSAKPQAESCAECEHNQWGSGDGGSGKACKNIRRLALIPSDALDRGGNGIKAEKIAFFKVPVTSVKAYAGFVKQCAAVDKPPLAFVTEIHVEPDPNTQLKVHFNATEEITKGELIGPLIEKMPAAEEGLLVPYEPAQAGAARPARGGGRAPAGRSAPAAKTSAARPAAKKTSAKKY